MASLTTELKCLFLLVVVCVVSLQAAPVNSRYNRHAARRVHKRDAVDGFLPRTVWPNHYDLEITPDIYSTTEPPFSFSGSVKIYVNCTVETDIIVINAKNIGIIGVDVKSDPNNVVQPPSPILLQWELDTAAEFLIMHVANPLEVGYLYTISVYFTGTLTNNDVGLNWNSYVDADGSTKYMVVAKLQDLGARQVFPCLDEPDMKATYNVTILSQPPMVTLSNMPELYIEDRGSYKAHHFATTPKMSTYVVAIVVGDLVAVPADNWQSYTSYPITLYARPQVASQLSFAASIAAPLQKWLEDATGVPYPLPKMDHIALPVDSWEMENWGAITYGETYLLINPQYSGAIGRLRVARTIAHELAHQWFADLVTFKTYDDVWIREGFSQHYGYRALDAIGWPGCQMQQADDVEGTLDFLNYDSLNTSDPVRKPVSTIWDADAASEGSTYQKGGAVVRQLMGILTNSTFRTAITNFLTKFSYGSVTSDDLWAELSAQAALDGRPLDVGSVTNAWLDQWGYPLVFVSNNGNGTATAMPRQYFCPSGQSATTPSPYGYSWDIPVSIATQTTTDFDTGATQWIPHGVQSYLLSSIPSTQGDWYMLNIKQYFFYRIDYDLDNRAAITNQLQADHLVIPTVSRCQYLDDTFQLSETLNTLATTAMDSTLYLSKETEYNPWHVSLKHLRIFDRLLQNFLWYTNYKRYISSLVLPLYIQLGWDYSDSETAFQQLLRRDILINACYYGLSDCQVRADDAYAEYKANPDSNNVDPNNLPTVLCHGVAAGDGTDWSMVFQQYQNRIQSSVREERYAYLFAMACSSDTFWLDRYLSYILQGTLISPRDQDAAIFYLAQNRVGLPMVKNYYYNSWSNVPSTISKFDRLKEIADTLKTYQDSNDFNNFVGLNPPSSSVELSKFFQMDHAILQNVDWIDSNEYELQMWLDAHNTTLSSVTKWSEKQIPISPMVHWNYLNKFH